MAKIIIKVEVKETVSILKSKINAGETTHKVDMTEPN